jgi:hypothetical protein
MRLRPNEFCPFHRSLSCSGRELVFKPKPIRLGVERFERVWGPQITGRAKTDEPQGSTTRRDMCDLPRRVY